MKKNNKVILVGLGVEAVLLWAGMLSNIEEVEIVL